MRTAVRLLAMCAGIGCTGTTTVQRDLAYAIARRLPGVNDSSLTIPTKGAFGYPSSTTNPLAIRRLLHAGEFARLDSLFDAVTDSARLNYRNEYYLFDAYDAMSGDASLARPLDHWARVRPTSAAARIAKATFLVDLAWQARGTAWARKTPAASMAQMQRLLAQAVTSIDTALGWMPQSAAAYRVQLEIAKASGDIDASRRYLTKGLEDVPGSFSLRRDHMRALSPRWGGSYDAMRAFADESEASQGMANPRLQALAGYVQLDSAEVLELQGRPGEALSVYGRAIAHGDEESFHLERGQLLVRMRRYRDATIDLDMAVASAPTDGTAYLWRGMARQALGSQVACTNSDGASRALADYQHALVLDPTDSVALDRFAWLYTRIHQARLWCLRRPPPKAG
jgi:tetratricopeptide (TPR) repeat protein